MGGAGNNSDCMFVPVSSEAPVRPFSGSDSDSPCKRNGLSPYLSVWQSHLLNNYKVPGIIPLQVISYMSYHS